MFFSLKRMFCIFKEKGSNCYYCGKDAETLDHFTPKAKGGTDDNNNLIPSCRNCNHIKHSRTIEEFRILACRKLSGVPKFSEEQTNFLSKSGFELPKIEHKFWFEKEGIKINV